jgi:hypothetical protein
MSRWWWCGAIVRLSAVRLIEQRPPMRRGALYAIVGGVVIGALGRRRSRRTETHAETA